MGPQKHPSPPAPLACLPGDASPAAVPLVRQGFRQENRHGGLREAGLSLCNGRGL